MIEIITVQAPIVIKGGKVVEEEESTATEYTPVGLPEATGLDKNSDPKDLNKLLEELKEFNLKQVKVVASLGDGKYTIKKKIISQQK